MTQTCFSYNHRSPDDFSEKNLHVFISYDNYLHPCCMTGSQRPEDGIPMGEKNLKSLLDEGMLEERYYDDIQSGNPIKFCVDTCTKPL